MIASRAAINSWAVEAWGADVVIHGHPLAWGIAAVMSTALGSVAVAAGVKRKHDLRRTRLIALLVGGLGWLAGGVIIFTYDSDPSQSQAFLPDVLSYAGIAVAVAGVALVTRRRSE